MTQTLNQLRDIIEERRKDGDPASSYVAKMFSRGRNKIAQKVGEETTEVIIAALTESKQDLVNESADLLFHLSMLWADKGVTPEQVMAELHNRMGTSGIDEKAGRQK